MHGKVLAPGVCNRISHISLSLSIIFCDSVVNYLFDLPQMDLMQMYLVILINKQFVMTAVVDESNECTITAQGGVLS